MAPRSLAIASLLAAALIGGCLFSPALPDAGLTGDDGGIDASTPDASFCPSIEPGCCDSCMGDIVSAPKCTQGQWQCDPGFVSSTHCAATQQPTATPFCSGPQLPTSQDLYSYPGCEDAGSYGCPNMLVFFCAMRAIEARHNSCVSDSDCVPVFLDNCVAALTGCPPAAVNDAGLAAFLAEVNAETGSYCGDGGATCMSNYSCGYSYSSRVAGCLNGRCAPMLADAG